MDELLRILNEIDSEIDYANETNLIDGKCLDSLSILELITEICDTFDIEIGPKWMRNENFNSVDAMWNMIESILNEK